MKAVLDIGKTNVKLQLVNESGQACDSWSLKNSPLTGAPYPHADVTGIWQWLLATLRGCAQVDQITALIVTTHGATAALVNTTLTSSAKGDGLVLPVLDYEFAGVNDCDKAYREVRPDFTETLSPALPAGLNLGRQLFWLQQTFPNNFARATHILMYPQYWGWRLTGAVAGEVTSLGCHTDLWSPRTNSYSSLVEQCQWQALMPPLKSAWQPLGNISSDVVAQSGLPLNCLVYVGLHDSNASYLRYLVNNPTPTESFTVISTGTWTILMRAHAQLASLNSARDMLANCDIYGAPIVCARFMGGREYAVICERLGGDISAPVSAQDVQSALDNLWMVTPDFSDGNGPYGGLEAHFHCPKPAPSAGAIATLYCALMIDQRLSDLQATGPVYIEGAFLKNPLLCQLVAQLRGEQPVYLSADETGTVQGAILLTRLDDTAGFTLALENCAASHFAGLNDYRAYWHALIAQAQSEC
jgi:sugar (pentulose or hexulose) kinase